jgi:hypothetical protein
VLLPTGTIFCGSPFATCHDDVTLPDKDELDIFSDIWQGIEKGVYEANGSFEDDVSTRETKMYSNENGTKVAPSSRAYKKARLDYDDTPHKKPATPLPKRVHEIPMSPHINQYSLTNKAATFMAPIVSPSPMEKMKDVMESTSPKAFQFQPPLVQAMEEMHNRMPDIFDAEDERKARAAPPELMEDISNVFDDVYDKLYWKAVQKAKEDEERQKQEQELFQRAVENAKRTYVPSPTCLRVMAKERKKEENARKKEEARKLRLAKKAFHHPTTSSTPMATRPTGIIMDPTKHHPYDNIVNVKQFGMMI